mmetsp:Transcript_17583/g.33079  ORF Transcript_17583/g.33079 Transcript_17583/m.33079 type:complete len:96 (-) Transcript_17583:87-374(-)
MARLFAAFFLALAALAAETETSPQEFLAAVADQGHEKSEEAWKTPPEPPVTVAEAKVVELNAAENPYIATGITAECLALVFMLVSCVICYLECCK